MPLRIVFCGTPAFAVPSLRHLIAQPDFQIAGVVTQPDRPRGRGRANSRLAGERRRAAKPEFPSISRKKLNRTMRTNYFKRVAPDVVVIIAYGQIIPARLIAIPRLGWINLHGSLLPKYRGAAPINWAIVNGETRTGLTTMQIDPGLDTGPMLLKYETAIGPDETAPELTARLAEAGAPLMAETLRKLDRGEITPTPQDDSQATFAPLLKKEDGRIDWTLRPRRRFTTAFAACNPGPGRSPYFAERLANLGQAAQASRGGWRARHPLARRKKMDCS